MNDTYHPQNTFLNSNQKIRIWRETGLKYLIAIGSLQHL